MSYTFGAGTGDDINWVLGVGSANMGATSTTFLVAGWFYPTTLTAGRTLWSFGNVLSAEIHTGTSELQLNTDNTTDGTWTTTGVGLAVSQWTFVAVMGTFSNTGPTAAWRVWSSTLNEPPVECTVTAGVAPVGNFVGNGTLTVGNKGTGTVAFQGDIDEVDAAGNTAFGNQTAFSLAAAGAITDSEADLNLKRVVIPLWAGYGWPEGWGRSTSAGKGYAWGHLQLITLPQVIRSTRNDNPAIFSGITPTINGATVSQNGQPRPNIGRVIHPQAYGANG